MEAVRGWVWILSFPFLWSSTGGHSLPVQFLSSPFQTRSLAMPDTVKINKMTQTSHNHRNFAAFLDKTKLKLRPITFAHTKIFPRQRNCYQRDSTLWSIHVGHVQYYNYQYSNRALRFSGQTSIFGGVFSVSKCLLEIEGQKKSWKFSMLPWKPQTYIMLEHWYTVMYCAWPIIWL